ncbi:MAG: PAS domain-containing sensor histidine kinase [Chitinophagaceae bacterium]|nr:PAS domain-containing sensor histidine kinase [Chitinophagaceae bacterium]
MKLQKKEYGYTREQFRGLPVSSIMADPGFVKEIKKVLLGENKESAVSNKGISRRIRRDGQVMMMEYHAHLVTYTGAHAAFLMEQNVTEKLELEAMLDAERLARQQMVTDAVLSAQEHERREIGIELHDNINQVLASARLYLGLVKSSVPEQGSFVDETDKLITRAIDEIRNLSHSLIPPSLNESALLEALDDIVAITRRTSGLAITRQYQGVDESKLSDKLKLTIYRIVQEQFNNILKYAQAKSVSVRLQSDGERITLSIKDDGVGFDPQLKTGGVGLMNMKTRASLFNGDIQVISSLGNGCELVASMNIETPIEIK